MRQSCCIFFTIISVSLVHADQGYGPVVTWKEPGGGEVQVQGSWMATNKAKEFASFQGIPYTSPPILQKRFLRPEKLEYNLSLTQIDARGYFRTMCPQPGDIPDHVEMSEDCLYLNVYTFRDMDVLKPVMVWIHGGSFSFQQRFLHFVRQRQRL